MNHRLILSAFLSFTLLLVLSLANRPAFSRAGAGRLIFVPPQENYDISPQYTVEHDTGMQCSSSESMRFQHEIQPVHNRLVKHYPEQHRWVCVAVDVS